MQKRAVLIMAHGDVWQIYKLRMHSYLHKLGIAPTTMRTFYNVWKQYITWCRQRGADPSDSRSAEAFLLDGHTYNTHYYALKHGFTANKWPFKVSDGIRKQAGKNSTKISIRVASKQLPRWQELDILLREFPRAVPLDPDNVDERVLYDVRGYLREGDDPETKNQRLKIYWLFLFFQATTGMRFHDVFHIANIDISLTRKEIIVVAKAKGGVTKSFMIRRDVLKKYPVTSWLVPHFDRALNILHEIKERRVDLRDISKMLRAVDLPQTITYKTAYREYRALLLYTWQKAFSPKKTTPHDLRRTIITTLLRAGAPLPAVQRYVQHASVETTARYYVGTGEDALAVASVFLFRYAPDSGGDEGDIQNEQPQRHIEKRTRAN